MIAIESKKFSLEKTIFMDPTSWRIIQDSLCDGSLNMLTDHAILLACNEGKSPATLRLYGWKGPTLSIGYSQDISKYIDIESCQKNNIPVVRRFTGGRALLHQYELTYSVIAPIPHKAFPATLRGSFEKISQAILESLKIGGIEAIQVSGRKFRKEKTKSKMPPACFAVSNNCEIIFQGKKLVGSAQRRLRRAFLQHGSVILDTDPQLTHGVLKYSSEIENHLVLESLISNTTTLNEILQRQLEHNEVAKWFVEGFQKSLPGNWIKGKLTKQELSLIETTEVYKKIGETVVT